MVYSALLSDEYDAYLVKLLGGAKTGMYVTGTMLPAAEEDLFLSHFGSGKLAGAV